MSQVRKSPHKWADQLVGRRHTDSVGQVDPLPHIHTASVGRMPSAAIP